MMDWRPTEYPGYSVSDFGQVRGPNGVLPVGVDYSGHRVVLLVLPSGQLRKVRVYQLLATAFIGPRPKWCHTRHLNNRKTDDRLSNLSYGTPWENSRDTTNRRATDGFTPIYHWSVTVAAVPTCGTIRFEDWVGRTGPPLQT